MTSIRTAIANWLAALSAWVRPDIDGGGPGVPDK